MNVGRIILEPSELSLKSQASCTDGAISLFGDDDFCQSLVRTVIVINLIPIDKQDDICILLDGPGLT